MYSVNVPLPDPLVDLATRLRGAVPEGTRPRRRLALVLKRLPDRAYPDLARETRTTLDGTPACAARLDGLDAFEAATGPVVHLRVESPGLHLLHERLCGRFDPVPDVEGADYVPHVTLGRGGDERAVARFCEREVEPLEWAVEAVTLYDAAHREPVETIALG